MKALEERVDGVVAITERLGLQRCLHYRHKCQTERTTKLDKGLEER
jgi:hypothetical protein